MITVFSRLSRDRIWRFFLTILCIVFLTTNGLMAGVTGKLAGRVFDERNEPLPGANIQISGSPLGAASDLDGFYYIINIPPGTYSVEFSFIGYKTRLVQNVTINVDRTTNLDATLEVAAIEGETVTVIAEKPVVELNLTSSVSTVGSEEIQAMPVLRLNEIVDLQAGVVNGHFRGGRLGEVQYQINGVTVNNLYDNSMSLQLDRSLLQEVQVISGTFDAEYGQAMSGVVNVVLKSGSEQFSWNAEMFLSDYMYTSGETRGQEDSFRPFSAQNYQFSLSGPTFIPKTYFLGSFRRFFDEGYIYGERRFLPTDSADFERKIFTPSGDNQETPLSEKDEITGLVKITNNTLKSTRIEYQAIFNRIKDRRYNFAFRFNPDGRSRQNTVSLVNGLDITHTFSAKAFMSLSLRQNYFEYSDYLYEDVYDTRYDEAGPPMGDIVYEWGAIVQGAELSRFRQKTNAYVGKLSLTSQLTRTHLVKAGLEAQTSELKFGVPGYIISSGTLLVRHVNEPPDYPGVFTYHPLNLVAFAQDQIEWQDFIFRAGLRWEYFDANSTLPSDLQNPANSIEGAPESLPKSTSTKTSLAPRLGVSYPITASAALFFAYGHFYQMPALGQIFSNSNYEVLTELQAGGISYGVLGNPDIKPERTVQYEFGYKHAITADLGLDLSIFYKDIRDLLGVEFISTYAAAEYARLTNVDFGNVIGFTLALDQRRLGPLSTSIDYTWQRAMGNSSNPRETATRAAAGEDPRPRLIPLNWDQRHTLNATLIYQKPNNYVISTIARLGSGQPYTPAIRAGFGGTLEDNSGRKTNFFVVDLRAEKYFQLPFFNLNLYMRILNLFDTRSVNGFVFNDTGSPDYSLDPIGQRGTLINPGRYYPPRRVEIGINLTSSKP